MRSSLKLKKAQQAATKSKIDIRRVEEAINTPLLAVFLPSGQATRLKLAAETATAREMIDTSLTSDMLGGDLRAASEEVGEECAPDE